jgi:hypothetical protein
MGGVGEQLQALEDIAGVFAVGEGEIPAGIPAEATVAAEPLMADVATPKIIQGSSSLLSAAKELVTSDATFAMANRTGFEPTPLGKGTLAGTDEVTLVAHGNANQVALGNKALSPQNLPTSSLQRGGRVGRYAWPRVKQASASESSISHRQEEAGSSTRRNSPINRLTD